MNRRQQLLKVGKYLKREHCTKCPILNFCVQQGSGDPTDYDQGVCEMIIDEMEELIDGQTD